MKKLITLLFILLFKISNVNAQQYYQLYYNLEMQAHVTANHGVRIASEKLYQKSYENQQENMEVARDKVVQVVAMKNQIYSQLRNINSYLKQGKQVENMYYDFQRLIGNLNKMITLSTQNPQYAILITRFYEKIYVHSAEIYQSVAEEFQKEDKDYLMDSYDRQAILNKIHREINALNGWTVHINNYLSKAKKKPYFRHIKAFDQWYIQDRAIIKRIITNYGYVTNPW